MVVGGPMLSVIGVVFGARSWAWSGITGMGADPGSGLPGFFIVLVPLGVLLYFVGLCLLIAAVHRALVKIDALPAPVRAGNQDNWYSNRR